MPTTKGPIEPPPVRVAPSRGKGRGVYATRRIRKGEIFERAPVIVIPKRQWRFAVKTIIDDYAFDWGPTNDEAAVVLGYGSLYNHSHTPNAKFVYDLRGKTYNFVALRDIQAGEEICTNYNGDPDDHTPLWFENGNSAGR
jgi:SET domain-containing protein